MAIIESFWLYGKPGTRYRAHIYQDSIETPAMPGSSSLGGKKKALLEDGALLRQVDENTFKNTVTGGVAVADRVSALSTWRQDNAGAITTKMKSSLDRR